jgi:hypothetical protein
LETAFSHCNRQFPDLFRIQFMTIRFHLDRELFEDPEIVRGLKPAWSSIQMASVVPLGVTLLSDMRGFSDRECRRDFLSHYCFVA